MTNSVDSAVLVSEPASTSVKWPQLFADLIERSLAIGFAIIIIVSYSFENERLINCLAVAPLKLLVFY